ncbi:MAG: hypothetical protein SVZ03_03380 [Spirochaetota bacterium]|nr:hypothetical protein [Spirochaetota bacterium]
MISKRLIIISSVLITLFILFIYIPFRTNLLEKKSLKSLISSSKRITIAYNAFEKGKNIQRKNLYNLIEQTQKEYSNLEIIAFIEKNNTILMQGKNDENIKDNETFDSIMDSFIKGEYIIDKGNEYITRYFNQMKYYIFVKDITDGKILMIFPYKLSRALVIQLLLEISLIIIISIISTSLVYIHNKKLASSEETPHSYINISKMNTNRANRKKTKAAFNMAMDSLNDYCFELFTTISSQYSLQSISLYLMNKKTQQLNKTYELKGNSYISINSSNFDSIDIQNEMSEELKKSAIIILENGKKLILPILYDSTLLGIISIIRESGFRGKEINTMRAQLSDIGKPLSEYLLFNDIIINEETGLYSKTYFRLKYDEQRKLFQSMGNRFAVFIISILNNEEDFDVNEKNLLIKSTSSKIRDFLKVDDIICWFNDDFVILAPNLDLLGAIEIGQNILDSLGDFFVKAPRGVVLKPKPYIGIATTDSVEKDEDILDAAFQNVKYAQTIKESNVQYTNIHCASSI